MPTGYTAKVGEGATFEEFVWACARAFGALVLMRDEPRNAPIDSNLKPSSYHSEELSKAKARIEELTSLTLDAVERRKESAYAEELADWKKRFEESADLATKYRAMIERVSAWTPPSAEHTELKAFMLKQLRDSLDFDTGYLGGKPEKLSGAAWLKRELKQA